MGLRVAISRTSDHALPLLELHRKVWEALAEEVHAALLDPANRVTTADYLPSTVYDGLKEEGHRAWDREDDELGFSFSDASGCCSLSMRSAWHWARMAYLRIWTTLGGDGWEFPDPGSTIPSALVRGPSEPLVYISQGMFAVPRRLRGKRFGETRYESDEDPWIGTGDSRGLRLSAVQGGDRDMVELASLTGQCQCDLCMKYLAATFPADKHDDIARDIVPVRRAWELLEAGADGVAELEAAAAPSVNTWNWTDPAGPPQLQALRDRLAAKGVALSTYVLAGIVASRARE